MYFYWGHPQQGVQVDSPVENWGGCEEWQRKGWWGWWLKVWFVRVDWAWIPKVRWVKRRQSGWVKLRKWLRGGKLSWRWLAKW